MGKALLLNKLLRDTVHELAITFRQLYSRCTNDAVPLDDDSRIALFDIAMLWYYSYYDVCTRGLVVVAVSSNVPWCRQQHLVTSRDLSKPAVSSIDFFEMVGTRKGECKQLHPVTREWVISLVHCHVLSVAQAAAATCRRRKMLEAIRLVLST